MITPHILNLKVKKLKFLCLHNFNQAATTEANSIIQRDFDLIYFSEDQVIEIVDDLDLFIIYIFINCRDLALECLKNIRETLDGIFVKNLLLVNRFFKKQGTSASADIGTLAQLPDDILYVLNQIIYRDI
jgi:hypothetical protein